MRTLRRTAVLALVVPILAAAQAAAQSPLTENTLALDDPGHPGAATLADVAWLAGSWQGEGLGGEIEEVWAPASAGTMIGAFKSIRDGQVSFYEFLVLEPVGSSLALKLKHFHPDLVGWEEPDDYVTFPLVRVESDAIYFRGLTFRRVGADELEIYLALTQGGVRREEPMTMRRR